MPAGPAFDEYDSRRIARENVDHRQLAGPCSARAEVCAQGHPSSAAFQTAQASKTNDVIACHLAHRYSDSMSIDAIRMKIYHAQSSWKLMLWSLQGKHTSRVDCSVSVSCSCQCSYRRRFIRVNAAKCTNSTSRECSKYANRISFDSYLNVARALNFN